MSDDVTDRDEGSGSGSSGDDTSRVTQSAQVTGRHNLVVQVARDVIIVVVQRPVWALGRALGRLTWRRWAAAVAALAIGSGAGLGWVFGPPVGTGVLGDPRTADPCALVRPTDLGGFGSTELDPAYGGFQRCDVIIDPGGDGARVDVEVRFSDRPVKQGPTTTNRVGAIDVVAWPAESERCARTLRLPDGADRPTVVVSADYADDPGTAPLCEIADSAATTAATILDQAYRAGQRLTRRPPFHPDSLANLDACAVLDAEALTASVPGLDANHPQVGYGRWECGWSGTVDRVEVDVRFDQSTTPNAGDGRPTRLGDRDAFVTPDDDSCTVHVVHRSGPPGRPAELLQLSVREYEAGEGLPVCAIATTLSEAAVTTLPKV